jgi:putative ABC transport system permease protein
MRNKNLIDDFIHDLGYAFRILRRSAGFTVTAVLALALGIGANTAIFTVVNSVLLQPLAYPEPDRLVQLELSSAQGNGNITSIPKFNNWRAQTQVFSDVAAYDIGGPGMNLTGNGLPEQLKSIHVSESYFRVFGAPIAVGRPFSDEEDRPAGPKLAVLNNHLWHNRFGGDQGVLGKTLELGGEPYIVTGVLGPNFSSTLQRTSTCRYRSIPTAQIKLIT